MSINISLTKAVDVHVTYKNTERMKVHGYEKNSAIVETENHLKTLFLLITIKDY